MTLKDRIAIVTGGGQGIGKEIAKKLSAAGAKVIIADINEEQVKQTAGELGIDGIALDVSRLEDAEKAFGSLLDKYGRLDILINNAGITRDNLTLRMSEKEWDQVIQVNLKGTFNCCKAAMKPMLKQRSGTIVNVASVIGQIGNPGQANYAASKAGVIALTKTLAKELSSRCIRVNAVAPGFIRTKMTDVLPDEIKNKMLETIPLKRFGEPEDVANLVLFLAGEDSGYITGQVIRVDGGMVIA
ncbi:MAG TPA: 3-oxoacyl-[acyl-carrier-protein] reductase [bacterium]|nr:3-oxoacyl-[acyl-carrier-protein] reductase [bacterium]